MSQAQQVVLVTGASSGIGAATSPLLAERGYKVFGTSRRPRADSVPAGVETLDLDVRSDASVEACVATLLGREGRIDVLVNNAGFMAFGPVPAYDHLRGAALAAIGDRIGGGLPPARVAEAVLRAVRDRRPRLRCRVGREATWVPRARALAPPARFEATVRRMFGLDAGAGAASERGGAA